MRLLEFLERELPNLTVDCGKFLKEIRYGRHGFLYRGRGDLQIEKYKKFASRVNSGRKPMNTSPEIHTYINNKFKGIFKWWVRNGVFASAGKDTAEFYGQVYLFFPIGDYKYVWSPEVRDLYTRAPKNFSIGIDMNDMIQREKNLINELLSTYKDTGLLDAIINVRYLSNEISFNCQHYYLINPEYETELRKELTT